MMSKNRLAWWMTFVWIMFVLSGCGGSSGGSSSDNSASSSAPPASSPSRPAAPSGLAATPADARVQLSWSASIGATSYNIKRATNSGGVYSTIQSGISATSYTNTGLTNGTLYYFVVSAVNAAGESNNSNPVSATPIAAATVPAAPTGLSATATAGDARAQLAWSVSAGATSYTVKRAANAGGPYAVVQSGVSTTSYTNTGLTNGSVYYYVVTAINAVGESANSNQVSVTPTAPVTPPPGGRNVDVHTADELTAALASALPGDVINLADGIYNGKVNLRDSYYASFGTTRSGTAQAPITLRGSRAAVIDGGSVPDPDKILKKGSYGLHWVGASYWQIVGISVINAQKGIVLDGNTTAGGGSSHVVLDGIRVYNIEEEGIHLRAFSSDNVIKNSDVSFTGRARGQARYGEGIYIGSADSNWGTHSGGLPDQSDRNQVVNNRIIRTGAESIDIKEGTHSGLIKGNYFDGAGIAGENFADSWVDVKGNDYIVEDNHGVNLTQDNPDGPNALLDGFQTHNRTAGGIYWGANNIFRNNIADIGGAAGYGYRLHDLPAGNVIYCNNQALNTGLGFANVPCTP